MARTMQGERHLLSGVTARRDGKFPSGNNHARIYRSLQKVTEREQRRKATLLRHELSPGSRYGRRPSLGLFDSRHLSDVRVV